MIYTLERAVHVVEANDTLGRDTILYTSKSSRAGRPRYFTVRAARRSILTEHRNKEERQRQFIFSVRHKMLHQLDRRPGARVEAVLLVRV